MLVCVFFLCMWCVIWVSMCRLKWVLRWDVLVFLLCSVLVVLGLYCRCFGFFWSVWVEV